jgi:hypothetical protein
MTRDLGVRTLGKNRRCARRGTVELRTSRHAVVLKLRSIAPAIVPVAMNGAFGANATVAHRFTCFTYGCWYAIVASPRTAPPPFDEMIEGRGLSKRRAGDWAFVAAAPVSVPPEPAGKKESR